LDRRAASTSGGSPANTLPLAVWTARQLSTFLAGVVEDSLVAFWWLAALRGLRPGELCGLRWAAVDLDRELLSVELQRTTVGYDIVEGDPKTAAGCRARRRQSDPVQGTEFSGAAYAGACRLPEW
jgi:integrase